MRHMILCHGSLNTLQNFGTKMNIIREMIEETKIGRLRLKYAERVRQAYDEGYEDALLTTADTLEGGIGVGHSIVDSPASCIRRTTSALLTSIKHRYDADDVCIDCGYDEGERYMQPQQNTNPTRMMLRSAERKAYEDAIKDAIEVIESLWTLDMPDGSPAVYRSDAIASLKDLMEG